MAKATGKVVVYDQSLRRCLADPRKIIRTGGRVAKAAAPARGLIKVTGDDGRVYWADPADLTGPGSPEAQARDTGPVKAGGTTGMGKPRATGPSAALPGDGPQARLPGEVADRTVIKSAGWTDVYSFGGGLVGVVKSSSMLTGTQRELDRLLARPSIADEFANVYDARRRRVGIASLSDILPVRPGR